MSWKVPRIWEGGDVYILGGGPSITEQFAIPKSIVNQVMAGSLPLSSYSPYLSYLHDKHVIAINAAFLIGDWMDMVLFGDANFYLANKRKLAEYSKLKVSCDPNANEPWVKKLARNGKHHKGISMVPGTVSWNKNSGAAAISVAAQAGAKRILLLGFDMTLSKDKRQHFHNMYGKGEIVGEQQLKKLPFHRHLTGFAVIKKDAQDLGIEIINLSPNSAIEEFPKMSVKEFIEREATK